MSGFGELLHEAWVAKRALSPMVTNPHVEAIYRAARDAGALGGKLLGAGGGGFMLLFVEPERQPQVRAALHQLIHVPFDFEYSGSQVIFFNPDRSYAAESEDRAARPIEAFRELEEAACA